jgi:DNA-binding IclR family transcriptional regulator
MDRLEVCVAIARSPDGLVNATDLHEEIGMAQSRVRNQLVALAEGELLSPFPRTAGKHWYERRDSPLWQTCIALYEERVE